MQQVYDVIAQVGPTDATVLITGQSGTGKEMVARALHHAVEARARAVRRGRLRGDSRAADRERAVRSRARARSPMPSARASGLLAQADGGTLFLDEIAELPASRAAEAAARAPGAQRASDRRRCRDAVRRPPRLPRPTAISRRWSSSASSARTSTTGSTSSSLPLPPLRVRAGDVLLLAQHFIDHFARMFEREVHGLTAEAAERLVALRVAGQRARAAQRDGARGRDVRRPRDRRRGSAGANPRLPRRAGAARDRSATSSCRLEEIERRHILRVLDAKEGNKLAAVPGARHRSQDAVPQARALRRRGRVMTRDDPRAVPPAWPALVALGRGRCCRSRCSRSTSSSIATPPRTRRRLSTTRCARSRSPTTCATRRIGSRPRTSSPDQIASIAEQIDADARAYDPLATSDGEGDEWNRLQGLLAHLRHEQPLPTTGSSATLVAEIETSIARLVAINQAEARRDARRDRRRASQRAGARRGRRRDHACAASCSSASRCFARCAASAALLGVHLASLDERTRELAAFARAYRARSQGAAQPDPRLRRSADAADRRPRSARWPGRIGTRRRSDDRHDRRHAPAQRRRPRRGRASVAVAPAVREAIEELRGELRDAEVIGRARRLYASRCSAERLRARCCGTLMSNAAKYRSPDRRLAAHVAAQRIGDRIEIAVTDNGIGMAPRRRPTRSSRTIARDRRRPATGWGSRSCVARSRRRGHGRARVHAR